MSDIVERLARIVSACDERGLDETERRAMVDAKAEITRLRAIVDKLDWWMKDLSFKAPEQYRDRVCDMMDAMHPDYGSDRRDTKESSP